MKRAPIIEDWSRFNRAVLEVADGNRRLPAQKPAAAQPAKHEATEFLSEPGDGGDTYGLIARQKWRKQA